MPITLIIYLSVLLNFVFNHYFSKQLVAFDALLLSLLNPASDLSQQDLVLLENLIDLYFPWLVFLGVIKLFFRLFSHARKRKAGAVILVTLIQFLLPDPYVDRTIKTVVVQTDKQSKVKAEDYRED